MAVLDLDQYDGFAGKIGRVVIYNLNGQWVKRTIGARKKTNSIPVLATHEKMKLLNALLKPANVFLKAGFGMEAKRERKSAYCLAYAANSAAIEGQYPQQFVNYSRVIWTKGNLASSELIGVEQLENGLKFNWQANEKLEQGKASDHVMMMAYFPGKELAIFEVSGQKRATGTDILYLPASANQLRVETYMAFIAADHSDISTSIYTGQYNWGA